MFLVNKYKKPVEIFAGGEKVTVDYSEIGMEIDIDKSISGLKHRSLTEMIERWLFSPSRTTLLQPTFVFSEDFERLAIQKLPKRTIKNEKVTFNNKTGLLDYSVEERNTKVDTVDLQVKLISFADTNIKPVSVEILSESSETEEKINRINARLGEMLGAPLEIILGESGKKLLLGRREILEFLTVQTNNLYDTIEFIIDKNKIGSYLEDAGGKNMSRDWTTKIIKDSLLARYHDGGSRPVVLGVDTGPNTDGSVAKRYVEIDLSQQKMFFFDNGDLIKSYSVSTGLNYPTPTGSYKIKNKLPMGYSGIFGVWMPWWMAFEYRDDIGAYLGIHELPYKLEGENKIYRFGNYIGHRKTGGCIALSPGDSKEVYDLSFPGMDLVIMP